MALRRPLFQHATGYFEELGSDGIDMNSQAISNLLDPVLAQDAATKAYVDAVATGLDLKASVRVLLGDTSGYTAAGSGVGATLTSADDNTANNTHDGVLLVVGNRVLVAQTGGNLTTPDADNGIYVVTTLADGAGQELVLTRASDFDVNAEVTAGAFTFVTEGTTYADTGWVLVTNDPITVDTTALQFSQFSSATAKSYGAGLSDTANVIDVELDTAADAQSAGSGGGSSGLEFDAAGAAGQLRAAVNATAGLQRTGTGLGVKLNGTTLASAAGGLSVDHSPRVQDGYVSAEALTQYHPVAMSTTVDRVQQARGNDDARAKCIGLGITTAGAAAVAVEVVKDGVVAGAIAGATAGDIFYIAAAGGLSAANTPPAGGNRVIQVGIAKNATDLIVQIIDYGKKAA